MQGVAVRDVNDIEVVCGYVVRQNLDGPYPLQAGEGSIIGCSMRSAIGIPLVEVLQLDPQNASLDSIQPAVVSLQQVIIFGPLAVITQDADGIRNTRIVCRDCPRFATGA